MKCKCAFTNAVTCAVSMGLYSHACFCPCHAPKAAPITADEMFDKERGGTKGKMIHAKAEAPAPTSELLPCPFACCSSPVDILAVAIAEDEHRFAVEHDCVLGSLRTAWFKSEAEARERWNTRK
jgi:hypothetical protein